MRRWGESFEPADKLNAVVGLWQRNLELVWRIPAVVQPVAAVGKNFFGLDQPASLPDVGAGNGVAENSANGVVLRRARNRNKIPARLQDNCVLRGIGAASLLLVIREAIAVFVRRCGIDGRGYGIIALLLREH